jgi:23S rRNA (pseudouridine1915-N3)-methyltransferase
MKLRVVWVGKTKNPHIAKMCTDYAERIRHFLRLDLVEVKEPKGGMHAEAEKILDVLEKSDRVVILDPKGKLWTSEQLARFVQQHMTSNSRHLTFVIGGYEGLADSVKTRADVKWSLSPLTFTHDITRVLLLEQLYRALAIIHNLPYSR